MNSNGRIFPGGWPGGDAVKKRQDENIAAAAQQWADDMDRRAFDHARAVLAEGFIWHDVPVYPVVRLGVLTDEAFYPSRVCSGRERLGE